MREKVIISVSFDREKDHVLLRWLEAQENKSAAIREALRAHIGQGVTLGDIYQAIRDLERRLQAGTVAVPPADAPSDDADVDEPPDVAAALEALAKM